VTTITPEIRQAINAAAGEPARLEDPETHEVFVLLKEETYKHRSSLGWSLDSAEDCVPRSMMRQF